MSTFDQKSFDTLIEEAEEAHFSGWDFSYIRERFKMAPPPWTYRTIVESHLPKATTLLDMGTGGGEFLASLSPLPANVAATEQWPPNVPIARARLKPLDILVVQPPSDDAIPFDDTSFDLIINRHESYAHKEVERLLKPGGLFITQQVGRQDNVALNELLSAPIPTADELWDVAHEAAQFQALGLAVRRQEDALLPTHISDIGAIVYYLRAIPWQIEGFSVATFYSRLQQLDQLIRQNNGVTVHSHRFLLIVEKPMQ